jgi:hypothetical protein
MSCFGRYLRIWLFIAAAVLLGMGVFNLLVDPFRAYRLIPMPKLDAHKDYGSSRIIKAEMIHHGTWDVIMIGSSRVEIGLDPDSPAWGGLRVFNGGLPGAFFGELADAAEFAIRDAHPRTLVLMLDFFGFTQFPLPRHEEFAKSRFNPNLNLLSYHQDNCLTLFSTDRSFSALYNTLRGKPSKFSDHGLKLNMEIPSDLTPRQYLIQTLQRMSRGGPFRHFAYDRQLSIRFGQIARLCQQRNIQLHAVLAPAHAIMMEHFRMIGLWDQWEQWKRDLTAELPTDESGGPVPILWDCFTYNPFTTEPIPSADHPDRPMRWYWEPSHFRTSLGDILIRRVNHQSGPTDAPDVQSIGRSLTAQILESSLSANRLAGEQYRQSNPESLNWSVPQAGR